MHVPGRAPAPARVVCSQFAWGGALASLCLKSLLGVPGAAKMKHPALPSTCGGWNSGVSSPAPALSFTLTLACLPAYKISVESGAQALLL